MSDVLADDVLTLFSERATVAPDRAALAWLPAMDADAQPVTRGVLHGAARRVATAVGQAAAPGDRVLLAMRAGPDFVSALLGTMFAGAVPVPIYPPTSSAETGTAKRIISDCEPKLIWTDSAGAAERLSAELSVPARFDAGGDDSRAGGRVRASDIAFLQYTSGSTDHPRGVAVTHGNLVANLKTIASVFGHDPSARILCWLPPYHDMGLVGNVLHPLYSGAEVVLTAPSAFIADPVGWLTALARFGIDTSGGPNFAYSLVAHALAKHGAPDIDLRGWRTAYCGAEPIDPAVLRRFADLLAPTGFTAARFVTCYGLAEATLLVTASRPGAGPRTIERDDGPIASCGQPAGCEVLIVDASGRPAAPGSVGEVYVHGDSVAPRYWAGEPGGEPAFGHAVTADDRRWLRTGDLGLIDEGDLFICGRRKETLIIRGRNLYPHDIERCAEQLLPMLRRGCTAAISEVSETVTVVAEERRPGTVDRGHFRLLAAEVAACYGVTLHRLMCVPPGTVPKTTSGKLRRRACAALVRGGGIEAARSLSADDHDPAAGLTALPGLPELRRIALVMHELPGIDDYDAALTSFGLDSLAAVRVAGEFEGAGYPQVTTRMLLDGMTLRQLLAVTSVPPAGPAARPAAPAQSPADGALSWDQRTSTTQDSLTFLQLMAPESGAYNISFAWQLPDSGQAPAFGTALSLAIRGDGELSTTLARVDQGFARRRVGDDVLDQALAMIARPVAEDQLDDELTSGAEQPFSLGCPVLFRLDVLVTPRRTVYHLVVHHLIADMWSLTLLLKRVAASYGALLAGRSPVPRVRGGYDRYVRDQARYLRSAAAAARDDSMAARMRGLSPLDLRVAPEPASESGVERAVLRQWLPAPTAARLRGCDAVSLLAAVWGVCLSRFSAGGPVAIGMPMLGRTEAGHAELPGVCTNTVPVLVDGHPDGELPALIRSVRSQLLDALDHPLYPLSRAVAASAPARLPGRMPLVESFFTYHETPDKSVDGLLRALAGAAAAEVTCGQLSLRSVPVRRLSCRCDLDLVVTPADGGFAVELSYRSSRLGARAAGSILSTFMAMVERATCGQARRVADLYVLSRDDEAGLRDFGVGWTAAAAGGFWQLLARNAQPTAAAIEAPDLRLDYGQLGGHVDAVARYLMRRYGAQSGQGGGPVPGQGTDRGRED